MNQTFKSLIDNINTGELGISEFTISVSASVIFGIVSLLLYRLYFLNENDRNESLAKSFIIIAPSVCSIFWAIQYSLPLSLGLLGALSFVRFRAPIKKGEDIGFILFVIALSLLSSIYRLKAAMILVWILIFIILVKKLLIDKDYNFLLPRYQFSLLIYSNKNEVSHKNNIDEGINDFLKDYKNYKVLLSDVINDGETIKYHYQLTLKNYNNAFSSTLAETIQSLEGVRKVEVLSEA